MKNINTYTAAAPAILVALLFAGCEGGKTGPGRGETAPGLERQPQTAPLESGASALQSKAPVGQISMYLVGFYAAKADPKMQTESHHYCDQVNEDFAQCVLYDGNTNAARLNGVEYVVSEKLYATLPADERAYWHPHNYEILSGTLRMPGLPPAAEQGALKLKLNSYGKTWHLWKAGTFGQKPDPLPFGPPRLAWSFNHDGEANTEMIQARDSRMGLDTTVARHDRAGWAALASPQGGVDAMAGKFPGAKPAPTGVSDNGDQRTRAVTVCGFQRQEATLRGRWTVAVSSRQ